MANRKKGGWGKLKNRRATMKSRVNILPEFSLPTTMTDHQHDDGMHGELDFENQPVPLSLEKKVSQITMS